MRTTARSRELLPDEVWSGIPRATADRRFVSVVLIVLVCLVPIAVLGNAQGILVPRLSYEGGQSTANASNRTITVHSVVQNNSARAWTITGASVDIIGIAHTMRTTVVRIPAHQRRTVTGVMRIDDCSIVPAPVQADSGVDIDLRVHRLVGTSTVTIYEVFGADLVAIACGAQ